MPAAISVPERILRMVIGKTEQSRAKGSGAIEGTDPAAPNVPDAWAGQPVLQGEGEIPMLPQARQAAYEAS